MELKELKEEFKNIKTHSEYLDFLKYEYYIIDESGNLIKDKERNEKYGTSRDGYKKFINSETNDVEHSGKVSLRKYNLNNHSGYIIESKDESVEIKKDKKLKQIRDEIKEYFYNSFNIDNLIKKDLVQRIMNIESVGILHIEQEIKWYLDIIEDFEELKFYEDHIFDDLTEVIIGIGKLN